jgi:hypothetical protein
MDERYEPGVIWGRPSEFAVGAYKNEVQEWEQTGE